MYAEQKKFTIKLDVVRKLKTCIELFGFIDKAPLPLKPQEFSKYKELQSKLKFCPEFKAKVDKRIDEVSKKVQTFFDSFKKVIDSE